MSEAGESRALLEDAARLRGLDSQQMLERTDDSAAQMRQALKTASRLSLPRPQRPLRQFLVCGMGGSAIGGDFVRAWLGPRSTVPFHVNRRYTLPGFAGPETLAFLSSYSGNTEETLSAFHQALEAGCAIVCLSSGGELGRLAQSHGLPLIPFPPGLPPRATLACSVVSLLVALSRLGGCPEATAEIQATASLAERLCREYGAASPVDQNASKQLALELRGRLPVVYGSQDRLEIVALRWRGQFSENGKQLAYSAALPEMNHNEIVGWKHPEAILGRILPLFLRDTEDHPRVQRRAELTRSVLEAKAGRALEFWSQGESWLERLFSLTLLGDYASIYLGILNGEDPTEVKVIDSLKSRLKEYV